MFAASFWLPDDISAHGSDIDVLIRLVHYFMAVLFVGWGAYYVYCLVKFRARPGQRAAYGEVKAKPSKYAEVVVVGIEAFLLIGIAMPVWAYYRNEPPAAADDPLEVRLVAQQFAWNMHYPGPDGKFGATRPELVDETNNPIGLDRDADPNAADDVVSINNFHVPKDRDVLVRLSSKDVIHCFAVPLLRVKQDVVPGMEIPIWFKATRTNEEIQRDMTATVELPTDEDDEKSFLREHRRSVAMESYGPVGSPVLAAGDSLDDDVLERLAAAGVTEIALAPGEPVNIQCAQLCGLGHYRMMGQMVIHEPEAFAEWYAAAGEEEEFFDDEEFEDEEDED